MTLQQTVSEAIAAQTTLMESQVSDLVRLHFHLQSHMTYFNNKIARAIQEQRELAQRELREALEKAERDRDTAIEAERAAGKMN